MLKKLELAQNITKRTKVKKDCKIQGLNYRTLAHQTDVLTITPRKLIERRSKFIYRKRASISRSWLVAAPLRFYAKTLFLFVFYVTMSRP